MRRTGDLTGPGAWTIPIWPILRSDGGFFELLRAVDPASRNGLAAIASRMEAYAGRIASERDRVSPEASR